MSGDENKLKKYRFPETLTNQSRWFGLPLDELNDMAKVVLEIAKKQGHGIGHKNRGKS